MPAGRPRLPTELKKMQGTLRPCREKETPSADMTIANTSVIVAEDEKISVPKSLSTRESKQYFKEVVKNLKTLHVLSKVDIKEIENLCLVLEQMRNAQIQLSNTTVYDEDYDIVFKRWDKATEKFDKLAAKFYITPQARTQLRLSDLQLIKTGQEVQKNNQDAIDDLLKGRQ